MPDELPNGSSPSPQNSGSKPEFPRILPPEGTRLARGEAISGDENEEASVPTLPVGTTPLGIETIEEDKGLWLDEEEYGGLDEEQLQVGGLVESNPLAGNPSSKIGDPELGLLEHLAELRARILYCVVAVLVASVITWNKTPEIQAWFARPILKALMNNKAPGIPGLAPASSPELIMTDPMGGFTLYFQISVISAILLTMPFLLFQVWRFVEPALTNNERRYTLILVPFSCTLFFLGAGLGYAVSPLFYQFFLQFQPPGAAVKWDYLQSVILMAKMLLVFGVAFQVPVVTIFLNKTGLVSRNLLIEYWRHAVVIIFLVVAILTPTWDPVTLMICAIPPCLLYGLSIWIVKWL